MTPESFVSKVRAAAIQHCNDIIKDLFESAAPEDATDAYWKRALRLYSSLNDEDRSVLFEIIRQTRVDTVSEVFGILDGICALEGPPEDFVLASKADNTVLNGDLQDLFLEMEELERQ